MVKKIGHILISGFLVTVIAGITINMHYCGDHLYSFRINSQADNCCDNNQCGHCKDKSVVVKIDEDFLPVLNVSHLSETVPVHLSVLFKDDFSVQSGFEMTIQSPYSPDIIPPGTKQRISLLQTYLL